jgi:hypothetical protein
MNVLNRKWWSRIALGSVGAFLAIQLVPYGRGHTLVHPARLSTADRDRLARGLGKTLGVALKQQALERYR